MKECISMPWMLINNIYVHLDPYTFPFNMYMYEKDGQTFFSVQITLLTALNCSVLGNFPFTLLN